MSIRIFRAYPLIEIRQAVPCRAIRGKSSDSRRQYLSQQYPPPVLVSEGSAFSEFQAEHAEPDPRHGTPTMAHFQPLENA